MLKRMWDDASRWDAVCRRDRSADGAFVFAVATTGVYCRPGCGARQPLRENVRFFADGPAARDAGFRACLRCRPDVAAADAVAVAHACALMTEAEEGLPVATLAAAVGMSVGHFHKVFARATGVTPRAWAAARREDAVRHALADGASVTAAIQDAGYGAASRFYEAQALGMTPSAWRDGAAGESIRFASAQCHLGVVLAAGTARGLCWVALGDDAAALETEMRARFSRAELLQADAAFGALLAGVVRMVEAPATAAALPLDVRGTAFQVRVWRALRAIPAGVTVSYAMLAERIGVPGAARAVARACATNDVAVVVPCHRVVRGSGDLAGYRWGIERKRALLARERELPR